MYHKKHPKMPTGDHGNPHGSLPQYQRSASEAPPGQYLPAIEQGNMRLLTTEELASELGMRAQSIRSRLSKTGRFFQLQPKRLPNRRLLWPADSVEQLVKGV